MWQLSKTLFWRVLALCSLALGLLGIPLPGLPTVPFLLLSAWAAGKGWPAFELWLLQHPKFGPPVRRWREHGAVPRKAKWLASVMMLLSVALLWLSTAPFGLKTAVPLLLLAVGCWLWCRPEVSDGQH
ncbi:MULTISPECIES: YbaN family protein [Rheinheimera]|uniref:Inner membrane protein n=1 Tax=Rheinheimera marina TaxID=1774958 RepID=A0ABV9JJ03_9GAMM